MNTQYTDQLYDDDILRIQDVLRLFRYGSTSIGGIEVESIRENSQKPEDCNELKMLEYMLAGGTVITIRSFDFEPKLEISISITNDVAEATCLEERIRKDLESIIYMANSFPGTVHIQNSHTILCKKPFIN